MEEKIRQYFRAHRQELLDDIAKLVAIDSTRGEAQEGLPYGPGPAAALECAMGIARGMGFAVKNYKNYVCAIDMTDKEPQLDILAHLDIVPVGDGWHVTQPLVALEKDGRFYGRGTADDKGPAMAALYAMKAVKDLGVPLTKNVRLILGTDEESGSSDLVHYYKQEKEAPMSFSPDGEFPVINIEKGGLSTSFTASYSMSEALPRIISVDGGTRGNVVPALANAVLEGMTLEQAADCCARLAEDTGAAFTAQSLENGRVKIECTGAGAHASTPEKGNNAVTALITLLSRMPFAPCEGFERLCATRLVFPHGDWDGKAAGVAMSDELSGKLTISFNIFSYTSTGLRGCFDSRAPLCANNDNMLEVLRRSLAQNGLTLAPDAKMYAAHHVPAESPFIRTLLKCYEQYTGLKGECLAIGGGTYVHHLQNGVAFGHTMPGTDNRMHGADESAVIDELLASAMIFTQVIIDLCS